MKGLLITETEKARKKQHEEVCKMYASLRVKYPDSKPYRIFHTIADELKMSVPGVVQICVNKGCYQPQKRKGGEYDTGATESEPYGALQC